MINRWAVLAPLAGLALAANLLREDRGPADGVLAPKPVPPRRQVLLSFDDLPVGQGRPGIRCDAAGLRDISRRMTAALVDEHAPSAAFFTTGNVCDGLRDPVLGDIIKLWERAGAVIGNHGHSHLDLSRTGLGTYTADLVRADRHILDQGGKRPRYFRHPFLHAGADSLTAAGLERWLVEQQYTVVPVTVDNNEWIYARAYTLARGRGDSSMMARLTAAYLEHIDQAFAFSESLSVRVLGEEIPQILLLHANELNADHLPVVLRVVRARGYQFVPVDVALAHPAYRRRSYYIGPWGISWLLRWSRDSTVWRMDLPVPPEWVER